MRIVAIGLGGAGCRIVDSLYSTDRKSSKVACIQGLAVDIDESTLQQLTALPETSRIFFPAMDPEVSNRETGTEPTATIDIAEIISRMHNFESGETDAILICVGLGGGMADIAPHVITSLRSSVVEPVFGLVTLPCLAEGEKRSAKAADDIDILSPLLDGMILFDNETWYKKTKALKATLIKKERSLAHRLGLAKDEPELSPELATYQLLNEGIVRRISLILRAGEFKADGGIDLAEVVLDSGEVLNTMKGMGFITIGYAVEHLPSNPLAFLSQFRPQGVFDEENKKKASRIVDLAKQAIYHEISTPCDMTSAHKALVLIAGPSHELSMKGFMTVRKWIDRSIAGLETRSGDYPVVNTKNVAIIIMLSGLENIPRITELREIRAQFSSWAQKRGDAHAGNPAEPGREGSLSRDHGTLRDEMIIMPGKMRKGIETAPRSSDIETPRKRESPLAEPVYTHSKTEPRDGDNADREVEMEIRKKIHPGADQPEITSPQKNTLPREEAKPIPHRVVVTEDSGAHHTRLVQPQAHKPHSPPVTTGTASALPKNQETKTQPGLGISSVSRPSSENRDAARQRIELELQKQRLKAMPGRVKTAEEDSPQQQPVSPEPVRKRQEIRIKSAPVHESAPPEDSGERAQKPEQKTVIVTKRKLVSHPVEKPLPEVSRDEPPAERETKSPSSAMDANPPDEQEDDMTIAIKDTTVRAKDRVFEGREVQKSKTGVSRDSSLIHTSLKPKKKVSDEDVDQDDTERQTDSPEPDHPLKKTEKKGKKPDDISWI